MHFSGPVNDELRRTAEERSAQRPPEINERLARATSELAESGILEGVLGPGDRAPRFARPDTEGKTVRLEARLKKGPVVLSFFRGRW